MSPRGKSEARVGLLPDVPKATRGDSEDMYARALDDAAARLAELRRAEAYDAGLAATSFAASLAMTALYPPLAVPLLVGGVAMGARAVHALWQRWDVVDRLADEREAYVIPEVRTYAAREAHVARRRHHAAVIRSWIDGPPDARIASATEELSELARELEDPCLELEPACAVVCKRLLTDPIASPLLNRSLPGDDVLTWTIRIRAGFSARTSA